MQPGPIYTAVIHNWCRYTSTSHLPTTTPRHMATYNRLIWLCRRCGERRVHRDDGVNLPRPRHECTAKQPRPVSSVMEKKTSTGARAGLPRHECTAKPPRPVSSVMEKKTSTGARAGLPRPRHECTVKPRTTRVSSVSRNTDTNQQPQPRPHSSVAKDTVTDQHPKPVSSVGVEEENTKTVFGFLKGLLGNFKAQLQTLEKEISVLEMVHEVSTRSIQEKQRRTKGKRLSSPTPENLERTKRLLALKRRNEIHKQKILKRLFARKVVRHTDEEVQPAS